MSKSARPAPLAQVAYLVVFGAFVVLSIQQLIAGTGTKLTWVSLGAGAVLFVFTAFRLVRSLRNTDV